MTSCAVLVLLLSQPIHPSEFAAVSSAFIVSAWIEVWGLHMTNGHIRQQPAVLVERLFAILTPWTPASPQDSHCPAV